MEWWLLLLLFFGGLIILLLIGVPVAFAFLFISILGAFFFLGGRGGLSQVPQQFFSSLTTFVLTPIPLFILLGEVLFETGMAKLALDVVDEFIGRVRARLSLVVAFGGVLFGALTGSTLANTALFGTTMLPEMRQRGYKKALSIGPIVGVGGLAMMIPPSNLAVILACIAKVSVGKLLMACAIPGLLMALFYTFYIIIRCHFDPSLAPEHEVAAIPITKKLYHFVKYIAPLGLIIFFVVGFIFLGIATPTEAAASGVIASFILAVAYRKLTIDALKKSVISTLRINIMVFMIIGAAQIFSNLLGFTGVSAKLAQFIVSQPMSPMLILISMQISILILGTFMESISIMMICMPLYVPIIQSLGFNPIWFCVLILINIEMGQSTPPFGILLFVMKGLVPPDTTMGDIIRAAAPFLICDAVCMVILMFFPQLALWLPHFMG